MHTGSEVMISSIATHRAYGVQVSYNEALDHATQVLMSLGGMHAEII